jgi:hypothetical protein
MLPYTAFTATSTVFDASVLKPFISTVQQLNMANIGEIFSDSFDGNASSKVDTVETKADAGSVSTSCTTQTLRLTSSIHKHCCTVTKEEKERTKKTYFCKYCPP